MTEKKQRKFLRSTTSPNISSNSMGSSGSSTVADPELRRTTSAIARFTRSVSKLGSRRRRGGSELPAAILDGETEVADERRINFNNNLSYETPIRRAETVPIRSAYQDTVRGGSTTVDVTAFLKAVPDLLGVDASVSNVGAAVRSAENLARSLRASAAEIDTSTTRTTTTGAKPTTASTPLAAGTEADTFKILEFNRQWEKMHNAFEAALAECRFEDALTYWQALHSLATSGNDLSTSNSSSTGGEEFGIERAWILEIKCSECAALLVSSLQQHAGSISKLGGGVQLQQVGVLLCQLVGLPSAISTILDASRARLRDNLESLPLGYRRAAATGSGAAAEEATIDLAAALGQALALGIATTAASVKTISSTLENAIVFGELSEWVVAEVAFGCEVLRKYVVLPRAAPAGLGTTTRCAVAFLAHCDELDPVVRIPVGQLAREAVWPAVEPVAQRKSRQLCDGLRKAAANEAKAAASTTSKLPSTRDGANVSWEELIAVFPCAKRLTTEVSGMAAVVTPIAGPAAVGSVRSIVTAAFMAFAESVVAPGTLGQKSSSGVAEIAMEIATRLVEHVLAESASVLSAVGWGPAVDAAAMVSVLEGMAKTLGMDTVG